MSWSPSGPERFRLYDGGAPAPAVADAHGLSSIATPSEGAAAAVKLLSPENPLFVLFAIGAVTLGFAAFSTSGAVRVGKTKVAGSLGVGKT